MITSKHRLATANYGLRKHKLRLRFIFVLRKLTKTNRTLILLVQILYCTLVVNNHCRYSMRTVFSRYLQTFPFLPLSKAIHDKPAYYNIHYTKYFAKNAIVKATILEHHQACAGALGIVKLLNLQQQQYHVTHKHQFYYMSEIQNNTVLQTTVWLYKAAS